MSDNNTEFMVTPLYSSKLTELPLHQNPLVGLQDLLKVNVDEPIIGRDNVHLYNIIKDALPNLSYAIIHKELQSKVKNPLIAEQMTRLLDNSVKYQEMSSDKPQNSPNNKPKFGR